MTHGGKFTMDSTGHDNQRYTSASPDLTGFFRDNEHQNDRSAGEPDLSSADPSHDLRTLSREEDDDTLFVPIVDADETGDYDPDYRVRRRRKRVEPRRVNAAEASRYAELNACRNRALKLSQAALRENGASLVVSLSSKVDKMKALTARIPDHWAEEYWNVFDADDTSTQYSADYKLRKRDPGIAHQAPPKPRIPDPCGEHSDLFGHPAARGCVACRLDSAVDPDAICSLLSSNSSYPCFGCIQLRVPCELLTPPSKRVDCDRCKRRKQACSYSDAGSDANAPCITCREAGAPCIAAPAPDGIRERVSYDMVRKFVACTACRRERRYCSLKTLDDKPPCRRCEHNGQRCTFDKLMPRPRQIVVQSKLPELIELDQQGQSKVRDSGNNVRQLFHLSSGVIKFSTSLLHPISFLQPDSESCAWCRKPCYGFGLFESGRRERLLMPNDAMPTSYAELAPDTRTVLRQESKMCSKCTLQRSIIVQCSHRELRALNERFVVVYDLETGQDELMKRNLNVDAMYRRLQTGRLQQCDRWCNLCPSPAFFQCYEPTLSGLQQERGYGCGLVLCEMCAAEHVRIADLDELIDVMRNEMDGRGDITTRTWPLGPRDDAELLKRDGLLVKSVLGSIDAHMD